MYVSVYVCVCVCAALISGFKLDKLTHECPILRDSEVKILHYACFFILCNSQIIQIQMRKAAVIFTKCNIGNSLQHNSRTITTSGMRNSVYHSIMDCFSMINMDI